MVIYPHRIPTISMKIPTAILQVVYYQWCIIDNLCYIIGLRSMFIELL